jgi:hypothetical protein
MWFQQQLFSPKLSNMVDSGGSRWPVTFSDSGLFGKSHQEPDLQFCSRNHSWDHLSTPNNLREIILSKVANF